MILKYKALSNRIKIWSFLYLPPGSVRALVCRSMSTLYMSIMWIDLTQVGRKKDLFSFDMTLNLLFKVQWLFCPKYFNVALLVKCFLKMYDCSQQCFGRIHVYFLTGTSSRLIDSSFDYTSEQTVWIWTHCVWIVWSQ